MKKPLNPKLPAPYDRMTAAEMERETAKYDAEFVAADAARPLTAAERKLFAAKAFAATATYDAMIASWFGFADQGERFPETLPLVLERPQVLRYGENPHQHGTRPAERSRRLSDAAKAEPVGIHRRGGERVARGEVKGANFIVRDLSR